MLAGSLIMFGMIVLQIGAFVWWVDREVADPERLADIATTVVRDETFQAAVAPEIADQLLADVPVDATGATADEELATRESVIVAVHEAMDDPAVVDAIGMAISAFAATVIGDGNTGDGEEASDQITLDLSAVKVSAVEILGDIDPDLAEQVAAVPVPSALSLDTLKRHLEASLELMSTLPVPTLSLVIGEGGSGGALAIGLTDRILMLEHAVYFAGFPARLPGRDPRPGGAACPIRPTAPNDLQKRSSASAMAWAAK